MPLPSRYQPPNLAISTLYWKAWPLLLVVAAFNPENIGELSCPWEIDHGPEPSKVPASMQMRPEKMLWATSCFPSLGLAAWEEYPTLKMLMEMAMTK